MQSKETYGIGYQCDPNDSKNTGTDIFLFEGDMFRIPSLHDDLDLCLSIAKNQSFSLVVFRLLETQKDIGKAFQRSLKIKEIILDTREKIDDLAG